MEKTKKRLSALVMAVVLLATLACGGVAAWAAGGFPDGENTLTVTTSEDGQIAADLKDKVVVDVYKIADGAEDGAYVKYNYTPTSDFSFEDLANVLQDESQWSASTWEELAEKVAKQVKAEMSHDTVNADGVSSLRNLGDGLFLILPHEKGVTPSYGDGILDSLTARGSSGANDYRFAPYIVAVPTAMDATGASTTAGAWMRDVMVALKPELNPYGDLVINKKVENFEGKPATFEFHIVSTDDSPIAYENYASIYYTGGTSASTIVKHIPAGTKVKVTESYEGGRFHLISTEPTDGTVTIVAGEAETLGGNAASVTFTNEPNGNNVEGHGINNNFTYTETKGEWEHVSNPTDALHEN